MNAVITLGVRIIEVVHIKGKVYYNTVDSKGKPETSRVW